MIHQKEFDDWIRENNYIPIVCGADPRVVILGWKEDDEEMTRKQVDLATKINPQYFFRFGNKTEELKIDGMNVSAIRLEDSCWQIGEDSYEDYKKMHNILKRNKSKFNEVYTGLVIASYCRLLHDDKEILVSLDSFFIDRKSYVLRTLQKLMVNYVCVDQTKY